MAVIGQIRQRLGWLLIAIIGLAIVAFLFMDIGGAQGQGTPTSNILAEINGTPISYATFDAKLEQNLENALAQKGGVELTDEERNSIRQSTYNEMVSEQLLSEVYKELGINVSDAEVVDMTTGKNIHPSIQQSFADANGNFDAAAFNQFISTLDIDDPGTEPGTKRRSWNNFENYIIKERYQNKYYSLIENGLTVPTWLADMQYNLENDVVNIEYVLLPYSDIDNSTLGITDTDLQTYIDAHANEYNTDEAVNIKFVSFPIIPSQNDYTVERTWTEEKTTEWATSESDSLFIRLYSETAWDPSYYTKEELTSQYTDTFFVAEKGTIFGPSQNLNNQYESVKLIDRKMIADSLQARHLLLSGDNLQSQEDVVALNALADSLFTLVDSLNVPLSSLTAQYSDDAANSAQGGDLGWIKKGEMVAPFENAIFYQMDEDDVKIVYTEFGIHIVEVYKSNQTIPAVKIATLTRSVFPSETTQRNIYSQASLFAGNNNERANFEAAADSMNVIDAPNISKDANALPRIIGDARQLIKWAYTSDAGAVSAPYVVGETYVVAMVDSKKEEGKVNLDAVRFLVEGEVAKEMKAEQLIAKATGADLNTIASSNGKSVATANGLNYNNKAIGASDESNVIGTALGLENGEVSAPIKGENGVYVVKVTSKVVAPESTDNSSYQTRLNSNMNISIRSKLAEAMEDAADIVDNRFDFF